MCPCILKSVCTDVPILPERDETGTKGFYKPIIFPNDFWHLRSQYVEINTTTPRLPLEITFQPMSYWKFQLFATMTYSFAEAAKQQGTTGGAEMDEIKRMLVETNPYLLGLTGLVSILHVLFVHRFSVRELRGYEPDDTRAALSSWPSAPMFLTGGRSRSSSECP